MDYLLQPARWAYFRKMTAPLIWGTFVLLMFGCSRTYSVDVESSRKIDETQGNFNQLLTDGDQFATSLVSPGDIDNDGVVDIVAGLPYADDNGTDRGAVWILFMDDNGQVDIKQKVSDTQGNFNAGLQDGDEFGFAVAAPGDLNNDGFTDIVVGAPGDDEGGIDRGAIYILFLDASGQVQSYQKIANQLGGLGDVLSDGDRFGTALSPLPDLDGDGINELLVGAPYSDDGGLDRGALWVLFMNNDGSVRQSQKISATQGGFQGDLFDGDHFANSVTTLSDLDGDGVSELVVGASGTDRQGLDRGAIWILFLNRDGSVDQEQQISEGLNEFDGVLADGDQFGSAVASLGDLNNDGIDEIGVGASGNDDGGTNRGSIWVLFPRDDGRIISASQISSIKGNLTDGIADNAAFGSAICSLGDLNGDGQSDIAVGANADNGGGTARGALWILFMSPVETGVRVDKDTSLSDLFSGS